MNRFAIPALESHLLAILLFSVALSAECREIPVTGGVSPDKKYEIVAWHKDEEGAADDSSFKLIFRLSANHEKSYSQDWGTFYCFAAAANPDCLRALWSPDSKFVVLCDHSTRHSMETSLYCLFNFPHVEQVSLDPIVDYIYAALTRAGDSRAYGLRPKKWVSTDTLELSCFLTFFAYGDGGSSFSTTATVEIARKQDKPVVKHVTISDYPPDTSELEAYAAEKRKIDSFVEPESFKELFSSSDKLLNSIYGRLKPTSALKAAQLKWVEFRDAHGDSAAGYGGEGGRYDAMERATAKRCQEFYELEHRQEREQARRTRKEQNFKQAFEEADRLLNKTYADLKPTSSTKAAQLKWIAYRDAHATCIAGSGSNDAKYDCLERLTRQRIRELSDLPKTGKPASAKSVEESRSSAN